MINVQPTKDEMALPARLREWADSNLRGRFGPGLLRIAADHIESLTAERDQYKQKLLAAEQLAVRQANQLRQMAGAAMRKQS